jgi:hypothetical protein
MLLFKLSRTKMPEVSCNRSMLPTACECIPVFLKAMLVSSPKNAQRSISEPKTPTLLYSVFTAAGPF